MTVFLLAYAALAWGIAQGVPMDQGRAAIAACLLAVASGLAAGASGLYQPAVLARGRPLPGTAVVAALMLAVAAWLCVVLVGSASASIASLAAAASLMLGAVTGLLLARLAHAMATRRGLLRRRLLILGEPDAAPDAPRFELLFVPPGSAEPLHPQRLRQVWAVIVRDPAVLDPALRRDCRQAGVRVLSAEEFDECRLQRVQCDRLPKDWLAAARSARQSRAEAALRRGFDIALAASLLLFTLPVMLLTAIAIRCDSRGPVFYRQARTGLRGCTFNLYKFRSMVVDAEAGGAPRWATPHDPRATRVGRIIRLTRIDELPQLLNVLRGEMSMVGPRPERPGFVEQLGAVIPHYHDRASVKPGITGWAQVNHPYGASVEDARMKLAYDLYYIRHRSLFLDLLILVATVRVVLFREGAR
ncbi:MAG: exopolysaccharide biosynthesis polyprenyl glycosylphosphotransferase [Alphaproteobacteria bacterium]|nr:exopolysaccharide biosynthesis polyprenyl glycosylphosphotransferase [Alphaproteobacteria bacterium]